MSYQGSVIVQVLAEGSVAGQQRSTVVSKLAVLLDFLVFHAFANAFHTLLGNWLQVDR